VRLRTLRAVVAGAVSVVLVAGMTGPASAGTPVPQRAAAAAAGPAVATAGAKPASSKITVATTAVTVGANRVAAVTLKCAATTTCTGTTRLVIGKTTNAAVKYSVGAKKSAVTSFKISAAQLTTLQFQGSSVVTVQVKEVKPAAVAWKSKKVTLRAANPTPGIAVATTAASVAADRLVAISLRCKGVSTCTGRTALTVAGLGGTAVAYSIGTGATTKVTLTLTAAQFAKVRTGHSLTATLGVTEVKPNAVASRKSEVSLTYLPPAPVASQAYQSRNWTPTAYDTCSEALHRSYSVVGPDGKLYPTWHPAEVVDPATGKMCTFGHEHGDDPFTSDIYGWVSDFLTDPDYPLQGGVPFGYVSETLVDYAGANAGQVTRHEDNVGHKIIVKNDVKLIRENPRGYVKAPDAAGNMVVVTCDYLIKIHQGSHSADATINNAHELLYAMKCTDGTELISLTMSRFGDANEFNRSCQPATVVKTTGSILPDGNGGRRLIPDRDCMTEFVLVNPATPSRYSDQWSMYEVWESFNQLTAADGAVLAEFDPWFAVRNPSRYFWPAKNSDGSNGLGYPSDLTWETDPADNGRVNAKPWSDFLGQAPFDRSDPKSAFDGAARDFYLRNTVVANAGGGTTWYTNPWGVDGVSTPFTGSVKQWVGSTDNTAYPALERQKFGHDVHYYYGHGVHAPN